MRRWAATHVAIKSTIVYVFNTDVPYTPCKAPSASTALAYSSPTLEADPDTGILVLCPRPDGKNGPTLLLIHVYYIKVHDSS